MTNWVIATVELPSKYIGFNLSPDYVYDYTQIVNIKTYVVPLNETFGFKKLTVYVRNSNCTKGL